MGDETTSVLFNAVPLLLLATAYLAVTAVFAVPFWRGRRRLVPVELALLSVFPAIAVPAGVFGAAVLHDRRPLGGHLWLSFGAILVALSPAVLTLLRREEAEVAITSGPRVREAQDRISLLSAELEAVGTISTALGRVDEPAAVARILLGQVRSLLGVQFAAIALVSEGAGEATGLLAQGEGGEVKWWPELRLDLRAEPSAIASAVAEVAPVAVFDVEASPIVNRRIAEAVGAKSAAFIPLVASGRVTGVLIAAETRAKRSFASGELALLEAIAGEAALALDRTRAAKALGEALERERLLAAITRRVRSEFDVQALLDLAVVELGQALRLSRCFVRLGSPEELLPTAQWARPGLEPVGAEVQALPASILAAREGRTMVVADIEADGALPGPPTLGGRDTLRELGTRSVAAAPIVVFDRLVGVFALHRTETGAWTSTELALAETIAQEVGLAIHTARLLAENRRQLEQQTALLEAARAVTGELHLDAVLQRLVEELAKLLECDLANVYVLDPEREVFRCEGVVGLPESLVGFEFPLDRGLAASSGAEGRSVRTDDHGALPLPMPSEAYAGMVSAIVTPVVWSGETRGILSVGSRDPARRFDDTDATLLEALGGLAALALRNAESYEASARQARVERGFYLVASLLGEPLSLPETLDAVARAAAVSLGGACACVLVPTGDTLVLAGSHDLDEGVAAAVRAGVLSQAPALVLAARQERVLAAPMLEGDGRFDEAFQREVLHLYRALIAVPVHAPNSEEGGLVVVFFEAEHEFSDDDLELARHIAQAGRAALERSELFETERHARALSQELARSGGLVASELDPAAVLDEVVERAPALLGVEAGAVWIADGDELVVVAAWGEGAEEALGARLPAETRAVGDVAQAQLPVALTSLAELPRLAEREPIVAHGYESFLGVPLARPEGRAVLAVYGRRPRVWRQEEIESLAALAGSTAAALANAELYQRVAQEKERSVAILANIADGIVAVDREGRVVLWNAAAERITGVDAADAVGRDPSEVLGRRLTSGDDASGHDRFVSISRGAEEVWLSLTEAVMRDPAGAVSGRIFAFRDISGDRAVEQMKSDFVSTVSHELRTPLTSIYGFAETLLRSDVAFGDEERRTFLGYIASEAERLTTIVDTLLNVARLDAGELTVRLASTNLAVVVADAVAAIDDTARLEGHRLVVELPPGPLEARADPEKLRQALGQLLDNAVKYSPGGGVITVGARSQGDAVQLTVSDEGIGVPHAEQERIFRKFYRGAARGGRLPGTGLGLFIAGELVAAMGGRIWVDSAEGTGSTFGVELPATAPTPLVTDSSPSGV